MKIIDEILRREGSRFTNDPDDPGGPTRWGITLETLNVFWKITRGHGATVDDVRNLDEDEARKVYEYLYIEAPGFGSIESPQLMEFLVDSGVQHGAHAEYHGNDRVIRWLQSAVGVQVDGIVGPRTLEAVNLLPWRTVYQRVFVTRMQFYGRIITDNPAFAKYAAGWMNRLSEFVI